MMKKAVFIVTTGLLTTMGLIAQTAQRPAIQIDARPATAGQAAPQGQSTQSPAIQLEQTNPSITDTPIDIKLVEPTSLKVLLAGIAQQVGLNLSMGDGLDKQVFPSVKEASLQEALDIILKPENLHYKIEGKVLTVFRPVMVIEQLDFSYITAVRSRSTSLSASATAGISGGGVGGLGGGAGGVSGGSSTSISGNENTDLLTRVEAMLQAYGSGAAGAFIQFNKQLGQIYVKDFPENIAAMRTFLQQTKDAAGMQVYIEARLIEVQLTEKAQAGVNWGLVLGNTFSLTSSFAQTSAFTANFSFKGFNALISALTQYGDVNVLSNPSVSTLNGQPAVVKIGTQDVFFVTQTQTDPRTGQIIQTAETPSTVNEGVVLDVTPNISKDGTIYMSIHPTITERTGQATSQRGNTVPILDIRETDTTLRVRDGDTIVIAGLIQDKKLRNVSRTPLSRLPWIGSIFGQKGRDNKKTDLVIMLTPHIFNLNQIEKITREREERLESLRQEIEKQVDPKAGQKKK